MSDDGFEIAPAQVPLSHKRGAEQGTDPGSSQRSQLNRWRAPILLLLLATGSIALLWWASQRTSNGPLAPTPTTSANPAQTQETSGSSTNKTLPPFAQTQQALARERAQAALAKFVEQQIQLEEQMAVGQWGQVEFDQALALASVGDEHFVDERFAQAQVAYDESTELLAAIIAQGQERIDSALAQGHIALDARDEQAATAAFRQALAIDSDNEAAVAGLARAEQLPEVKRLALRARNHELAGEWQAAVQAYEAALALDEKTVGLAEALQQAQLAVGGDQVRQRLSQGFGALEARRYAEARSAFNDVLRQDSGNEIALGGLQQVGARTELSRIAQIQRTAELAVQQEDWTAATSAYERALKLDANIQFAKAGIRTAKAQAQAATVLGEIAANPNKLSSTELLESGRAELARARKLDPQGPKLTALIKRSAELLTAYAQPVAVRLTSDNRTQVLVSTIGKLGAFDSRELSLRPGEYVLLGSRSGCRDVRRTVIVRPGMEPVDIRCEEAIGR